MNHIIWGLGLRITVTHSYDFWAPPQNRQLDISIGNSRTSVDDCVEIKKSMKAFCEMNTRGHHCRWKRLQLPVSTLKFEGYSGPTQVGLCSSLDSLKAFGVYGFRLVAIDYGQGCRCA